MSPGRRKPGAGKADRPDRNELDALRARIEAAGRTPRAPKKGRRASRWAPDDPDLDDGPADWEEPAVDPPTPLDERGGPWWDEHPGKPIPVEGGIAATTRKGRIGSTWWSQRFLASLEAVLVGGRMERGRAYARKGQVVSLDLGPGVVAAVVQGSRPEPYRLRLSMPVTTDGEWERIVDVMASQAGFAARLLAGDLPHEVEDVFDEAGASLFPGPGARLVTECTCPDFENPCKHVAAVCYLVAEQFDRDPFRVLEWRGRDRRAVVEALRALRGRPGSAPPGSAPPGWDDATSPGGDGGEGDPGEGDGGGGDLGRGGLGGGPGDEEMAQDEPGLGAERFWAAGPGLGEVHVRPVAAALPDAVLRQLPRGILTARGRDVAEVLAVAYEAFAACAIRPER